MSTGTKLFNSSVSLKTLTFAAFVVCTSIAHAVPIIVEDTTDRFEVTFVNDDAFELAPVGALDGRTLDVVTGGESAAIAITIVFRAMNGTLEDLIFVFENISTDPFFPGPNDPGEVLVFDSLNGFANIGGGAVSGDGVMPGFARTVLTVVVGPDRSDPFDATLVLSNPVNVPEPSALILLSIGLLGFGIMRRVRTT